MSGVITIEVEDGEEERFLRSLPGRVDRMASDLVDDLSEYASDRIKEHAPGGIFHLVEVSGSSPVDPGVFEAVAGVTPAHGEGDEIRTFGGRSNPDDYPFFVDQGTGIHGEFGRPIEVAPPGFMQIDFEDGRVRTHSIRGQQPQEYVKESYRETLAYAPIRIGASKLPSGGS